MQRKGAWKKGFLRRLSYYITGLVLGSLLVAVIFGERACSWTPSNRIKTDIIEKIIVFPNDQIDQLHKIGIDKSNIKKVVLKGKINYSESLNERSVFPREYIFEVNDSIDRRLQFSLYEDSYITVVHVLNATDQPKRYTDLKGWGEVAHLPRDSSLIFIDESNYTQCKARGLASKKEKDIIEAIKKTGRINFSKSNLMLTKATQQLYFTQNDTVHVQAETIWFRYKITFKDFIWDYKQPCEE